MKIPRIDFYASDWLDGTAELSLEQRGLYITACALIYTTGGPIEPDRLRKRCGRGFKRCLQSLIAIGKIVVGTDGRLDHERCEKELENARKRIEKSQKNGQNGGRPPKKIIHLEEPEGFQPSAKGSVASPTSIQDSEPSESLAAREEGELEKGNAEERRAAPPKTPGLRRNIKEKLRQKLMRYCNARLHGEERTRCLIGLMGEDQDHDAQWWLDELDRRRKREGWDDTRDWKPKGMRRVA